MTFKTGCPAGKTPADGYAYAVKPLNLNTRVNEADQVDTLNVFNGDSPSNDTGTLTSTRLTGLGMGDVSIIAGRSIDGGITYSEPRVDRDRPRLRQRRLHDRVDPRRAPPRCSATSGNDKITVKTIDGHTNVLTGDGDDTVLVGNDEGLVDQITALLTIDTGAGNDRVDVDDSQDTNANQGVLTGSSLIGLDMPTVPQVRSIRIQAASAAPTRSRPAARRRRSASPTTPRRSPPTCSSCSAQA